ncbi:general stress protein [Metaplanococcus flavidus]|uniref:General stress protein n=1 Tax=Metaplanococcus flavidus TaxID=569883 RepID=A0ABW3L5R8_9BACL
MEKHFIDTYRTQEEVLQQIEKLKDEGYSESDMYIMTQEDDQLSMIQGETNIDSYAEQGNWMDSFTAFLTGNKQIEFAFENMQLTQQQINNYYKDLENGRLLLYVNKDYEARFDEVGGDSFKLGEKEKTELQNRKEQSENSLQDAAEQEETVELDPRHYEDGNSSRGNNAGS